MANQFDLNCLKFSKRHSLKLDYHNDYREVILPTEMFCPSHNYKVFACSSKNTTRREMSSNFDNHCHLTLFKEDEHYNNNDHHHHHQPNINPILKEDEYKYDLSDISSFELGGNTESENDSDSDTESENSIRPVSKRRSSMISSKCLPLIDRDSNNSSNF
jgi:hypothetical protein